MIFNGVDNDSYAVIFVHNSSTRGGDGMHPRKVILLGLSLIFGTAAFLAPYPFNALLALISGIFALISLGTTSAVVGGLVLAFIVGTPFIVKFTINHLPWEKFGREMLKNEWESDQGSSLDEFETATQETYFQGIETLDILGRNIETVLSKSATAVVIQPGMKYKAKYDRLYVASKTGGKIVVPAIERINVAGAGHVIKGEGRVSRLSIAGMDTTVDLELEKGCKVDVAGTGNEIKIAMMTPGRLDIAGMSNEAVIDLRKSTQGIFRMDIAGTSNDVKVLLSKESEVDLKEDLAPALLNNVEVIRR